MKTNNTSINNIANINTTSIILPGIGELSIPAYNELMKLLEGWNNRDNIFDMKYNPYLIPALASYLRATGKPYEADVIRSKAMQMVWTFNSNGKLENVQWANRWTKGGAYIISEYYGEEFLVEGPTKKYFGAKAWEVIRDLCTPVAINFC